MKNKFIQVMEMQLSVVLVEIKFIHDLLLKKCMLIPALAVIPFLQGKLNTLIPKEELTDSKNVLLKVPIK